MILYGEVDGPQQEKGHVGPWIFRPPHVLDWLEGTMGTFSSGGRRLSVSLSVLVLFSFSSLESHQQMQQKGFFKSQPACCQSTITAKLTRAADENRFRVTGPECGIKEEL